ncbi:MAG TPA: hypothetical protein ENK18_13125 [Deltaproteobacteria bacterium]|nr:hypothetical protein [Deltaproteobacteria bacterium]
MNLLLSVSIAHAQPSATLAEGTSLLQPCLGAPGCGDWWRREISEALLETGLALQHEAMITSALIGKGAGPVVEIGLDTVALGERNDVAKLAPLVPSTPRPAAGLQLGGSDLDAPGPQIAAGLHGLSPLIQGRAMIKLVVASGSRSGPARARTAAPGAG